MNNLVNVITFQQMCQDRDKGVHAFLARLNSQAELCDMMVPCPEHRCAVSFMERLTMLKLVHGLQCVLMFDPLATPSHILHLEVMEVMTV